MLIDESVSRMPHPNLPVPDWRSGDARASKPKLYAIMECDPTDGFKELMEVHTSVEYAEQECWLYNNTPRGRGSKRYHIELHRLYGTMHCE